MMVEMSDGIGKIVEGYNSVISALENNRVLELVTLEKNRDSKKVQDLIKIAEQKKVKVTNIKGKHEMTERAPKRERSCSTGAKRSNGGFPRG